MEILSFCAPPLSPGTVSNALGASATSFAPMPRKPPTLTTKASILPDLSNRMSLIEPIFWLSEPSTSVPLNLVATHCSVCDCAAVGGLELEFGGELGDCANAPDTVSAPSAAPIINFFIMDIASLNCEWNELFLGRDWSPVI